MTPSSTSRTLDRDPSAKVTVGIVGHRGYVGEELVASLRRHPRVEPVIVELRAKARAKAASAPTMDDMARASARRATAAAFDVADGLRVLAPSDVSSSTLAVVLLATPNDVSLRLVPELLAAGVRVIDLSGAYRLREPAAYARWYGIEHPHPELLASVVRSLPDLAGAAAREARLVANPGCTATLAALALVPLAELVDPEATVCCDMKIGATGTGNKASSKNHFCAIAENFLVYGALFHRHVAEVVEHTGIPAERLSYVTQLLPVHRGLLGTLHLRTRRPLDADELVAAYEAAYAAAPLVRIHPDGGLPALHHVVRTPYCDLGVVADPETRRVVVVGALDNLGKGAATQAVQSLNRMLGWDETTGLT